MDRIAMAFRLWGRRIVLELLLWFVSVYVALVTGFRWRAWCRNSLALGYWSERSDLDITLFSRESAQLPRAVLWLWRHFQRFGEWAAFTPGDKGWAPLANPLELSRDPYLMQSFQMAARRPSSAEAFVFWLRMMGGENLKAIDFSRLEKRSRKWNFHLHTLESETGIKLSQSFPLSVEEMGARLSPVPREDWSYYRPFLWLNQWMHEALSEMVSTSGYLREAPPVMLDIVRAQVHWELWGLLGQVRLKKDFADVGAHLSRLADLFPPSDPIRETVKSFQLYLEGQLALSQRLH